MTDTDSQVDARPDTNLDEDDRLKPAFVRAVIDAVEREDSETVRLLVAALHTADIADLIEQVPGEIRHDLAGALGDRLDGDVIAELNDWVRDELMEVLGPVQVADIAGTMDTDDAVAMIEELDDSDQQAVLDALDPDDRAAIETALSYPEESAGRLMQRELIAVPQHWTVGDVIDWLRRDEELTTDFWEIFVVDHRHHPIGTCQLSWILRTPRDIAIEDVMQREQTLIPVDMDQEEVALRFQKYGLISAAVVDSSGRLAGMITVDDVLHIVQEEAGEDALLLSGAGDGDINEPLRESYKARVRWLVANLGTALVASFIISRFEDAIATFATLAVLMPIVASLGGNAGTQTMAVAVRALATNQLTRSNSLRTIRREIALALLNGGTVAVLIGIGTGVVFGNPRLGAVIATAMIVNILIAGLAGVLVPLTLERLDQDPAVASSVFVTMITDSIGFLAFLGLAVASGLV